MVMFHPFPATATNASFVVHHVKFLGGTEVKMSQIENFAT